MKYKYNSTKGKHQLIVNGKTIEKPGEVRNLKINGEFLVAFPGDIIESEKRIYAPAFELIKDEPKVVILKKKDIEKLNKKVTKIEKKIINKK